jgi:cyclomaltodextrin glucanotransferase
MASDDFSKDTIYFIVVDRFKDGDPANNPKTNIYSADKSEWKHYWGGDIQGIIDELPYIKSLGCTAIWITPIVENTESLYVYGEKKDEKITSYHGYWGSDYYRINPHFGTKEKFKELIQRAHAMDIKIIFDYVLNHTSPAGQGINGAIYKDGKFIADYSNDTKKWFHHNGSTDFRIADPAEWQNKNLFDLADLNSENPEVEKYLFDAAKMWMDMGIDSFRLDTVRHIPVGFAARFEKAMKEHNPNIFIFGEWSMGGPDVPGAVDFTRETGINMIDFTLTFKLTDVLCRNKSFTNLADHFKHDNNLRNPDLVVTCIDNHDMPRFISTAIGSGADMETAKKRTELATYLMMMSRGIPCIYYGTEQFLHEGKPSTWGFGGEPYNRQMMSGWNKDSDFFKTIRRLAELRREDSAVSVGSQTTLLVNDDVWVFERRDAENVVLVAVNKGKKQEISVDGVHLPDGSYNNSEYDFEKVIGPSIKVKYMKTKITLDSNEIGIWRSRGEKDM